MEAKKNVCTDEKEVVTARMTLCGWRCDAKRKSVRT